MRPPWGTGGRRPRAAASPMLLALAALAIVVGLLTDAAVRPASGATLTTTSPTTAGHSYRHGAVPLRHWSNATPQTSSPTQTSGPGAGAAKFARGGNPLLYAGGPVINGSPKVFLVFWGTQWGSQSLLGGYQAFSGDPQHLAPNLQAFLSGLGTNGELWSAIVTQYCQGALIGARSCPLLPSADHVAYPSSSVLGGVWEDTRAASPAAATATQIAQEGADAAAHFSHPANSQYIVVSPTGTDPDGWLDPVNGYCAYHDDTQDPAIGGVTGPDVPYTNMPYVPDVGAACSSFSSPGPNDGADETLSHEYAETLTDPYPSSGWNDRSGSEIGDKCENLVGGTPGGSIYLTLSTGTFVVQGLWANDLGTHGGCENVHSSVLVANPGKQRGSLSVPASLQISALDVRGLSLTYGALGLPTGLVVSPTTGLISGTPLHRGRFHATVDVIDSSGTTGVSFVWVIGR